jgi:ATP-binding cassette subfamily B (MDR/TAP) protein 1
LFFGIIGAAFCGFVQPYFCILIIDTIEALSLPLLDPGNQDLLKESNDAVNKEVVEMLLLAVFSLVAQMFYRVSFGIVGENVNKLARSELYDNVLRRDVGWFDDKEHSTGVICDILAEECQTVKGAGVEGIALGTEVQFGLLGGILMAFYYSW